VSFIADPVVKDKIIQLGVPFPNAILVLFELKRRRAGTGCPRLWQNSYLG
jgi:hypothetical protein